MHSVADMNTTDSARQLVRDVILAQSNVFIKELLIGKGIRGGATKADFQKQLDDEIAAGNLTYEELKAWVEETEGWGDEHIYLYKIPTPVTRLLGQAAYAEERVRKGKLAAVWNADPSLEFPPVRKLTSIQFGERELTFVWHQGTQFEKRAKEKDFERVEEDGERYLYKAWRIASRRSVTRIVIRPYFAAVFLPSLSEPKTHAEERASLFEEIAGIVRMHDWPLYSMGEAIKVLDAASLRSRAKESLRARHTRLTAKAGGYVEFASETDMSYADVKPLRDVRHAVQSGQFRGTGGDFQLLLGSRTNGNGEPKVQPVKVQLYGDFDRIRLWVRLTRNDVWEILKKIPKRSPH